MLLGRLDCLLWHSFRVGFSLLEDRNSKCTCWRQLFLYSHQLPAFPNVRRSKIWAACGGSEKGESMGTPHAPAEGGCPLHSRSSPQGRTQTGRRFAGVLSLLARLPVKLSLADCLLAGERAQGKSDLFFQGHGSILGDLSERRLRLCCGEAQANQSFENIRLDSTATSGNARAAYASQ